MQTLEQFIDYQINSYVKNSTELIIYSDSLCPTLQNVGLFIEKYAEYKDSLNDVLNIVGSFAPDERYKSIILSLIEIELGGSTDSVKLMYQNFCKSIGYQERLDWKNRLSQITQASIEDPSLKIDEIIERFGFLTDNNKIHLANERLSINTWFMGDQSWTTKYSAMVAYCLFENIDIPALYSFFKKRISFIPEYDLAYFSRRTEHDKYELA